MSEADVKYHADVLVIGGGPSGAWAAWSAAAKGADVILVDKGYLGTSGATAPGGTNLLYLPPDQELRETAVSKRMKEGGFLCDPTWIHRVLDQVYENLKLVEAWGYPFRRDENGTPMRDHLQGPEYMRLMRRVVQRAGVKILDQAPALELLVDSYGVGGARGVLRQEGKTWEVRANAVVIATGGCAFLSKSLGCNVLTGEGLLMAAESGVELSGMEFSRSYAPSAAFASVTRGRLLNWATFSTEDGTVLHTGGDSRAGDILPEMLVKGPVYAILDRADTMEKRAILRKAHAIFFVPYDRAGIDPFTQRFPLTLRYEGTVRGTGGIRIIGEDCSTTVPGLYAAGDAASRELVAGAKSGGGAFNASWAICSGTWSGQAAAHHSLSTRRKAYERVLRPVGRSGLESKGGQQHTYDSRELTKAVQSEVLPLEINYFRTESIISESLGRLNQLWRAAQDLVPQGTAQDRVRMRELASMTATARWMYSAALARRETRGMHTLAEYPNLDPKLEDRLLVSGIDDIRTYFERESPITSRILYRKEVQGI